MVTTAVQDRIKLSNIMAYGKHGALPEERLQEQPFNIDLVLCLDLGRPQNSDALEDTLDYSQLHDQVQTIVRTKSFFLLERLAGEILDAMFKYPQIKEAKVTIAKPGILEGATPAITLRRDNPGR